MHTFLLAVTTKQLHGLKIFLKKYPDNPTINSFLATALIGIGNIQDATVAVAKARKTIAPGVEMHLDAWLAGAYVSIGKPKEAEKLA